MRDTPTDQPRRGWTRRPLVIALLAAAVVLGLTSVTTLSQTANAAAPRYDGDTLVRGVYFGLGPIGQQYPDLVLGHIPEPERNTELLPRLFVAAERLAPSFRERFADALYSRDRVRIQRSVVETAQTLVQALLVLYPELADELAGDNQSEAALAHTLLWVWDVVALAAQVAIAAQAAAVVEFVAFWGFKDPSSPQDNQLRLERWADLAATTLPGT